MDDYTESKDVEGFVRKLCETLKVLGSIRVNQKVNFHPQLSLSNANSLFEGFLRRYNHESRDDTLFNLQGLLGDVVKIHAELNQRQLKYLIEDFTAALDGLQNLSVTYQSDVLFHARLEVFIRSATFELRNLQERLRCDGCVSTASR